MTAALSEPERLVRDALQAAFDARRTQVTISAPHRARDLVAALRPLLAADPEIVQGTDAAVVPNGTLLIRCTTDGEPYVDHTAFRMNDSARVAVLHSAPQSYRVLYSAPAPAPVVGDVVTTVEELNALPTRAAVRSQVRARNVLERGIDGRWYNTFGHALDDELLIRAWLPVRVLDLGGDS